MSGKPIILKKQLLSILLLFSSIITAQNFDENDDSFPFVTGEFHTTWAINENYTLDPDDDEPLLVPNSVFFRLGAGYQFNRRISASAHLGYDYHLQYFINAFPTYGSLRYNISEDYRDTFFVEYSRGKLWRPSAKFEDGDYAAFGLGWTVTGSKSTHTVIKITYHIKRIKDFENGRLDSLSLGIGFSIF